MTAIEDARAALAKHEHACDEAERIVGVRPADDVVTVALRELIAEHERLTTPPSDDEREALARAHFYDWRRIHPGTLTWATYGESHKQRFYDLADVAIGAGFRRQGPITDAQVDAALDSWFGISAGWNDKTRNSMRAVLEAARSAS